MNIIAQIPKNNTEEFRVTAEVFKSTPLVHLRIWSRDGEDYSPSHKGVAMTPDKLPDIITALQAATEGGAE